MSLNLPEELENGYSPLLKDAERKLLNEIYFEVKKAMEEKYKSTPDGDDSSDRDSDDDSSDSDPNDDVEKIEIILDNMRRIITNLNLCFKSRQRFIKKFPGWREVRNQTIESLLGIGESLHQDRRNCNISKLVGNVTSFCGGATTLISAALVPFTFGLSIPLFIAGGSATILGTATSTGTAITENVLLKNKVKDANTIINKDRESSEDLNSWLIHSCELAKALEFIKNIDVINDIMETIQESLLDVQKIENDKQRRTVVIDVGAMMLKLIPLVFETTKVIFNAIGIFARLICMLVAIILLYKRNRVVFECAMLTFKTVIAVMSVLDSSVDVATAAISLISGQTAVARSVGVAVTRGTLAVLSMTLDVASVVLTSIDVHGGSISQEGQKIIDVANKLKEEREILQKVFDDITHEDLKYP